MSYYFGKYESGNIKVARKLNEAKSNKEFFEKLYARRGFELSKSNKDSEWVNGQIKTGDLTGKYEMEVIVKRDKLSVEQEAELLEKTRNKERYLGKLEKTIVLFNQEKKTITELNKITIGNILKFENGTATITGNIHKSENGFFLSNSRKENELNLPFDEYVKKGKALGVSVKKTVAQNGETYIGFTKNIVPSKEGEFTESALTKLAEKKSFVAIKEIAPLSLVNGNNVFLNKNTKLVLLTSRPEVKEEVKEEPKTTKPKTVKKEAVKVVTEKPKTTKKAKTETKVEKPKTTTKKALDPMPEF